MPPQHTCTRAHARPHPPDRRLTPPDPPDRADTLQPSDPLPPCPLLSFCLDLSSIYVQSLSTVKFLEERDMPRRRHCLIFKAIRP